MKKVTVLRRIKQTERVELPLLSYSNSCSLLSLLLQSSSAAHTPTVTMTNNPCTPNAIEAIYNERPITAPILQVLNTKPMPQAQPGAPLRYRYKKHAILFTLFGGKASNEPTYHSKSLTPFTFQTL